MKPTTREELITYCKQALGAPVLEINVEDAQIEDRVDDAIQFYQEYHSDATFAHFRKHLVTQDDIDNGYITIPENLISIIRILPAQSGSNNMFSIQRAMKINNVYNLLSGGSVIDYVLAKEYRGMLNMIFDNGLDQRIRFNRHLNKLYLDGAFSEEFNVDDYIIIEGYSTINPDDYSDVYNDMFLKRYLTALIKRQNGINLKKFSGMQLPGGVDMNGQEMYDEAQEEISKIEEEMQLRYEEPPMMAVG